MSAPWRRNAVRIDSVELIRAPGVPNGFILSGFGPGINVIWGPNGSGKSTTARAIHSMFWPERENDRVHLEASFQHEQASWSFSREGKRAMATRNRLTHAPLTFPQLTAETRDRYFLALHELLQKTDSSFALQIAREMSGGYDIQAAAEKTGFEKSGNTTKLLQELELAENQHDGLLTEQKRLAEDRERLAGLEEASRNVSTATLRREWLERVKSVIELKSHCLEAENHFNQFDPVLEFAQVGDVETIARWERDEPMLMAERAADERTRENLVELRHALRLSDTSSVQHEIALLAERLDALRTSHGHLTTTRRELAAARDLAVTLSAAIGPAIPPDLQLDETVRLLRRYSLALDHVNEANQIGAAEAIVATQVPRPGPLSDSYDAENRLRMLARWLQTPPPAEDPPEPRSLKLLAIIAAAVIIVEAVLLGYYWHEYAYAIAALGAVIVLLSLRSRHRGTLEDRRLSIANEYRSQGYQEPGAWTGDAVAIEVSQSIIEVQNVQIDHHYHQIWLMLDPGLQQRQRLLDQVATEVASLEERIGSSVALNYPALLHVAKALEESLVASRSVSRLELECTRCQEAYAADLRLFVETVQSEITHPVADVATASAAVADLKNRVMECTNLDRRIDEIDARLRDSTLPALQQIERERQALIERYGGRTIPEIVPLAMDCANWTHARSTVQHRRDSLVFALKQLGNDFELDDWPIERVQQEIDGCRQIEGQAASTNQEIGSIRNQIYAAENSEKIAAALNRKYAARDALIEKRNDQILNSVGRLVLERVRAETRDTNLPQVARRARELFVAFTRGRYELRMGPSKAPAFSAWDTQLGAEQAIHELSSATRVQLLMAVRMAFVELQESDTQLPMIFDETLANADDDRADALIDTTLEIAAQGRQVFYFTAQQDEVDKWRARALEAGAEIAIIDLAAARNLAERNRPPSVVLEPIFKRGFPAPGEQSRSEYRRTLAVPQLDLWGEGVDPAHLWYLIDDLPELHQLIDGHYVTIWGQVRQYQVGAAAPSLQIDEARYARLSACADALQALLALTRTGRGKPLTEVELQLSGGMGTKLDDACRDLLKMCQGDGKRFVDYLEAKKLKGFLTNKTKQFRDYFEENGHIVTDDPIPVEMIRGRMARHCDAAINRGEISMATIDRLIAEAFPADTHPGILARSNGAGLSLLPSGE